MTLTLDSETIRENAEEYRRESAIDEEDEKLTSLPPKFHERTVDWDDYLWIVTWKSGGRTRPYFERNDRAYVDHIIELVLQDIPPSWKIRHLTTLSGVKTPTASAFLTFIDPERYTVIDYRSWTVLHAYGILREPAASTYDAADYTKYLRACRRVATEHDVDLRTFDRALFTLYENLDK